MARRVRSYRPQHDAVAQIAVGLIATPLDRTLASGATIAAAASAQATTFALGEHRSRFRQNRGVRHEHGEHLRHTGRGGWLRSTLKP